MPGLPVTSDYSFPCAVQHIIWREGEDTQLLAAGDVLFVPAILSHCNNRILFHDQHFLSQR